MSWSHRLHPPDKSGTLVTNKWNRDVGTWIIFGRANRFTGCLGNNFYPNNGKFDENHFVWMGKCNKKSIIMIINKKSEENEMKTKMYLEKVKWKLQWIWERKLPCNLNDNWYGMSCWWWWSIFSCFISFSKNERKREWNPWIKKIKGNVNETLELKIVENW